MKNILDSQEFADFKKKIPSDLLRKARITSYKVSDRPEVVAQVAMFEHGTRILYIAPNVQRSLITKALLHETGHAIDDWLGVPHYFSSQTAWRTIHRNCSYFDIPKYRDEPLEYFSDVWAKYWLWGTDVLRVTKPDEVRFIELSVIPVLRK